MSLQIATFEAILHYIELANVIFEIGRLKKLTLLFVPKQQIRQFIRYHKFPYVVFGFIDLK